jgi:hypothetical protein
MSENTQSGDNAAATLLADVADLVNDSRDSHGDAVENQVHTAEAWTWYLRGQEVIGDDESVSGSDVARMMELLKLSRACVGNYDIDHDRDVAGYAGIAAACEVEAGNVAADELEVVGDE